MHISPLQKYAYVLFLIGSTFSSFSQTHRYINPIGSNSGDCSSPGSPCQTIDYAITQAAANDVLNLTEGTFSATTLSARVILSGRGAGTIVEGITVDAAISGVNPVTIENLTVNSSSTHGVAISTSYVNLFNVNSSDHSGRNVNIDAASAIQNIEISNCVLDGGDYGLWISEQTDLTDLTVLNTSMDDNTIGFYSQLGNSASVGIRLSTVLIRNCTFNDNLRKGIYAEKLENAVFENITIDNSGTDATHDFNNGIDINLKWQAYSGITIRNSRVVNSGAIGINDIGTAPANRRTSAITIKARTDAGAYDGIPASLTNVTLDGVIIDGLVTDLRFGEMGKTDNDGIDMSTVTVQHCSFTNDDLAGLLNEENTNTLTIANNYWGGGAPTGSDIEDYGTSAVTSQSGELANEIVDASNTSYATVAAALVVGGTIQNLPSGTVSGTSTISLATTLISPGAGNLDASSLTIFETLNVNGANLILGSDLAVSTNLNIGPPRDLTMGNYNLLLSGTISGTGEVTGSSTSGVYVSGTGALGTITFTSGSRELERFDLNRTSGGTVTLGSDLDVTALSLTNGILGTGANDLNFTGNSALQGNENSFVNGNFVCQVSGSPNGNTLVFPIGGTVYRPISVEGVDQSATTNYTSTVTESSPPSSGAFSGASLLNKLSTTRYWTVTPSAANVTSVDLVTLTYGEEENVSDFSNIRVAQLQTSDWFNLGGSGVSPVSSAASPPNVIVLSLGDFALGDETSGTNFTEIATVFVNGSTGDDSNDGATTGTAKLTLAAGYNLVQDAGTINVAAATYAETLNVEKSLTLNGANAGIAASGTRGAEAIINPASNAVAVTVAASNVTIDGLQIGASTVSSNATTGILNDGNIGFMADNNIIYANSAGISIQNISTGTVRATDNLVDMLNLEDQTNVGTGSFGFFLSGLTGSADVELTDNSFIDASWGIFGFNLDNSGDPALIDGGTYTGCTKGIEIDNFGGVSFGPSTVNIQDVVMSGFTGPDAGVAFPDAQAGIYSFVGTGTAADDVTLTVTNANVSGVGNAASDYSGIYMGGFASAGSGSELNLTVTNSDIHDNLNRGIYVRGETSTANISQCTITGNGSDPTGAGGNPGFSVVARVSATVTVTNSTITNAAVQTSDVTVGLASYTSTVTVTDCSITDNGNGTIASGAGAGTLNLSRNWFGSTDEATILALVGTPTQVDFTPAIGSGTDTDGGSAGFQPDLSTLHVLSAAGTQTGAGRWQEGHDLVDASGTVVLPQADYSETVTVSKNVVFQPTSSGSDTSLDDLVMNGAGVTMTLNGNLLINNAVTLTDGNINVNSGELRLGTSASDITEISISQIAGMVTMDPRAVGTGAISLLGVSIAANAADNLGNVSISRSTGTGAIIVDGPNSSIAANWDITVDTQPTNAGRDVTFTWLSDFDNAIDMAQVSVFRNEGSGWTEVAGPFDTSVPDPRTVTVTTVTQFSQWSMAQDDAPLPVELTLFEGQSVDGKATLKWATMTELNADFFEVQKSLDGIDFGAIGRVEASGNSDILRNYRWTELASLRSTSFYRLRTVDFDGSFEYSSTVRISALISGTLQVYPNPAVDYVNIESPIDLMNYTLYDQNGRKTQSGFVDGGRIDLSLLNPGVYYLKVGKDQLIKLLKH